MAVVLKVAYQGQTHRIPFKDLPDYSACASAVQDCLPTGSAYATKYVDEEGDLCTLVESTFQDFLTTLNDGPGGQAVLRVEAVPLPGATLTKTSCQCPSCCPVAQRSLKRRQQPTAKPAWEDDKRDLDELLEQFIEHPRASKKNKKKTKKQTHQKANESRDTKDDACGETLSEPEVAVECDQTDASVNDLDDAQKGSSDLEEATKDEKQSIDVQYEFLEGAVSTQGICEDQMEDELWEMSSKVQLRRTSSCPCFAGTGENEMAEDEKDRGSLLAKAWPFVDIDKLSVDLSSPSPVSKISTTQIDTIPAQEVADSSGMQSMAPPTSTWTPASYGYQQVVWMPVVVNWPCTNFAVHASHSGMPFTLADTAIPAIG